MIGWPGGGGGEARGGPRSPGPTTPTVVPRAPFEGGFRPLRAPASPAQSCPGGGLGGGRRGPLRLLAVPARRGIARAHPNFPIILRVPRPKLPDPVGRVDDAITQGGTHPPAPSGRDDAD